MVCVEEKVLIILPQGDKYKLISIEEAGFITLPQEDR
jgi:hypothetical protein